MVSDEWENKCEFCGQTNGQCRELRMLSHDQMPCCPQCRWPHRPYREYKLLIGWSRDPLSRDTRHLALHLAKIAGALAQYEEEWDHVAAAGLAHPPISTEEHNAMREKLLKSKIPDLAIIAAMYAAAWEADFEEIVKTRSKEILARVETPKVVK